MDEPQILAVVKGNFECGFTPKFFGTREECYAYMRTHHYGRNWNDLMYTRPDPNHPANPKLRILGRMSSWVLE